MDRIFRFRLFGVVFTIFAAAFAVWSLLPGTSAQRSKGDDEKNPPIVSANPTLPDDDGMVLLNARHIAVKSPEAQTERSRVESFSGKRLHLVRFNGPIQGKWQDLITNAGAEIVDYIPHYTYMVWGDFSAIERIQSRAAEAKSPIQWDGPFKDEYRINPSVYYQPKADNGMTGLRSNEFEIQLYKDDSTNSETLKLVNSIKTADVRGLQTVRHFVNFVVGLDEDGLAQISKRPDVVSIYPYSNPGKLDERQDLILRGNLSAGLPTAGDYLAYLASRGFTQAQFDSSNFVVDLTDSGVDNATPASPNQFILRKGGTLAGASRFAYSRLVGTPHGGSTLAGCDGHGNLNGTIIAGYVPTGGIFTAAPHADANGFRYGLGVAPFVKLGSSVIFDPSSFTSPNLPNLQSMAYQDGARISSNSWGSTLGNGAYNANTQAYDALVRDAQPTGSTNAAAGNQEMVIVFAAGNSGPGATTIAPPGSGKNIISVGASENVQAFGAADQCGTTDTEANNALDVVGFSGRGPAADGRAKPDIMLPGSHVSGGVAQAANVDPVPSPSATPPLGAQLACFNADGVCAGPGASNFWPLGQQWYTASSGTSHSTPAISGYAALIRQHFINQALPPPSPAMTKALMLNSAEYMTGTAANDNLPSPNQGMGLADMDRYFDIFTQSKILRDQMAADTFSDTGQQRIFTGTVVDNTRPFRVTLAWTDPPGPTSGNAYINNLDLEVTVGGIPYKGNVFTGANSSTGGTADVRNNVESVYVPAGVSGTFLVRVKATNIAGDGLPDNADTTDQDFALLVSDASESPQSVVENTGISITSESGITPNNAPDPGENLTVSLGLQNVGTAASSSVQVTLLNTGGISNPSAAQNYGVLTVGGGAVTRSFSFHVPESATCGGTITLTFQVQDGVNSINVTKVYSLGTIPGGLTTFTNPALIDIPNGEPGTTSGPAIPYSSDIVVSGLTGSKAISVELTTNNHTWGGDLDILLEGPGGQKFIIMSDAFETSNRTGTIVTTMTIRDAASASMPSASIWPAVGDFKPTNFTAGDTFAAPAPAGPYTSPAPAGSGTFASVFGTSGASMNGTWKLWVIDDAGGDVGTMQGWKIKFDSLDFVCSQVHRNAERADFDGDGRTDLSVWRPSEGNWYLAQSTAGFRVVGWGLNGDKIQPADFDGDGRTDFGVFRPSNNIWYGIMSSDNTIRTVEWGLAGDIPVAGHYSGGFADAPAVFRPSNGHWYMVENFSEGAWGQNGDLPVPADYDGDGKTDLAVFRPSTGEWHLSVNSVVSTTLLGAAGDMPVPADYDGDGKDDIAIFRPSTGVWQILIGATLIQQSWGLNGDIPVPGDYDGDGKYDMAVYRPSEGKWYLLRSTSGIAVANWGLNGDKPAPVGYIPN